MTTIIQCYCTLQEMIADAEGASLDVTVLKRFILAASGYVAGEIGTFQPVLETRKLTGTGREILFTPPLLRLTGSIVNDETTLATTDYQMLWTLQSTQPGWSYGPYAVLRVDPEATGLTYWTKTANGIEIPGAWGLYERAEQLATTVATTLGASASSLAVSDGSQLSPGMVLQIGNEWLFVSGYGAVSAGVTTLGAALDASSETVSLADGTRVKSGEILRCQFEQLKVLDINGNDVFVARGWNRTNKVAHASGAAVDVYRTFAVTRGINGSSAAEQASGSAIEQMLAPEPINYLTRQIATLMMTKSQTRYAGRSGNAEAQTFYTHEFPRDEIERIKRLYYIPG